MKMNKIVVLGAVGLILCGITGCTSESGEKPPEDAMARADRVLQTYYQNPNMDEVIELTPTIAAKMKDNPSVPICGLYYGLATIAGADGERLRKAVEIDPNLATAVEAGQKRDRSMFDVPFTDFSPDLLDFYWGYFMATGDKTAVMKIVKRGAMKVPANCTMDMTAAAARWSAKSLAKTHPVVQSVVNEFLSQATEAEKAEFEQ